MTEPHKHKIIPPPEESPLVEAARIYPGVRFHEGVRDPLLVQLAQDCADLLVRNGEAEYAQDGHPGWDERFHEIRKALGMTGVEVTAMARPGEGDDIGHEVFYDWERSAGHWRVVSTPHKRYGDGLAKSQNGIWYATVVVAD